MLKKTLLLFALTHQSARHLVLKEGTDDAGSRAAQLAGTVTAACEAAPSLFVDDAEASLRLGLARLRLLDVWQTGDGEIARRLRPALAARIAQGRRRGQCRRTPAVRPAHAGGRAGRRSRRPAGRGFTDIELEAVETALGQVETLRTPSGRRCWTPASCATCWASRRGRRNLLARLGFADDAVGQAQAWAFGHADLAGWTEAPEALTPDASPSQPLSRPACARSSNRSARAPTPRRR